MKHPLKHLFLLEALDEAAGPLVAPGSTRAPGRAGAQRFGQVGKLRKAVEAGGGVELRKKGKCLRATYFFRRRMGLVDS